MSSTCKTFHLSYLSCLSFARNPTNVTIALLSSCAVCASCHAIKSYSLSYTIIWATPCPPSVLLAANSCFLSPASA